MKRFFAALKIALLLLGQLSSAQVAGGQIDVRVTGMPSEAGAVRIVLMSGVEGYQGSRPAAAIQSVIINDGSARGEFNVPVGTYAIIAHHDANADGTLNRPVFALPTEPYGYSNGAWTSFGLPAFDEVAFDVGDGAIYQQIQLRTNVFVTFAQLIAVATIAIGTLFSVLYLRRWHCLKHHSV